MVIIMDAKILNFISNIRLGEIKQYKNISIIPVFFKESTGPKYITLDEAISTGTLKIKEVSSGGSVPELIAENTGQNLILLLDGEEVIGAKQNRVLNATILLDSHSNNVIPVSCVEAHRWSSVSAEFRSSDNVLNYDIRRAKNSSVNASLKNSKMYMSNQGEIWEKIDKMSDELKVNSGTSAMRDVYISFDEDLGSFINNFPAQASQNGIFVFIDGRVAGFDVISQSDAYKVIHTKLIKSYCLDALRKEMARKEENADLKNKNQDVKKEKIEFPIASLERAKYFLEEIKLCNESSFKSAGLGYDYRYEGQFIVGSALLSGDDVIHMAFFKNDELDMTGHKPGNMQSYSNRMRNRWTN
jgi:hypothetical protein